MVQLKVTLPVLFNCILSKFQYLYGAVKSCAKEVKKENNNIFQYLYGAVKRWNS
ncbi:hypothetical protein MODO_2621 [Myroides odoratimimus]|nr:hypothetical protein MODO_2621 [Myroides odoratimimus]